MFKNVSKPQLTLYFSTALLSFLQAINLRGKERPSLVLTNWICKEKIISDDFLAPYYPIGIGLIAVGIYILTHMSTILDAYKLLARNEVHANRFGFKFRKKVRKKINDF